MTSLFDPITVGAIHAPNRIMMAPLTRGRATRSHVPTPSHLVGCFWQIPICRRGLRSAPRSTRPIPRRSIRRGPPDTQTTRR